MRTTRMREKNARSLVLLCSFALLLAFGGCDANPFSGQRLLGGFAQRARTPGRYIEKPVDQLGKPGTARRVR